MPSSDPIKRAEHNRTYYRKGGKAKIRAATKAARERNYEYVRTLKDGQACADCGVAYPYYVMDFDHLRDKDRKISSLCSAVASLKRLRDEIDKCELVCANCHRERTHQRGREA